MSGESVTIVGCGYVGLRLAKRLQREGRNVSAEVRSDASLRLLRAERIPVVRADLDDPPGPRSGSGGQFVYMVPPPPTGDTDPRLGAWLGSLTSVPRRIVYLSTTAVYGDRGGAVVSEASETMPSSARGQRRLDAESSLRGFGAESGASIRILRVPGIYGPGRLPIDRIATGQPIPAPGETGPGNRIHVDDLVGVCLAALRYEGPQEVFNVGDGNHAPMGEYFLRVASIAGLPVPPQLPLSELLERVSPAMRGFLTESRRVDVSLMGSELGFVPRFADLDAGIAASLGETRQSGR